MFPSDHHNISPIRVQPHSSGRPPQIRQTSFSKRHASFDTPREVPGVPERCFSGRNLLANEDRSLTRYIQNSFEATSPKGELSYRWPCDDGHNIIAPKINQSTSEVNNITSIPHTRYPTQKNTLDSSKDAYFEARNKGSAIVGEAPSRVNNTLHTLSKKPVTDEEEFLGVYQQRIISPVPLRPSSTRSFPHSNQMPHSMLTSLAISPNHTNIRSEFESIVNSRAWSELPMLTASLSTSAPKSSNSEGEKSSDHWNSSSSDFVPSNSLNLALIDTEASSRNSTFSSGSTASSTSNSPLFSSLNSPVSSIPAPNPPLILTPPPAPHDGKDGDQNSKTVAPHDSILSRNPAPDECYIAIDTLPTEYIVTARLPGYHRESITVTARRRRILHILADSWDVGGGHFERRISFGYDADLNRIRAEFDGEHLRTRRSDRTKVFIRLHTIDEEIYIAEIMQQHDAFE